MTFTTPSACIGIVGLGLIGGSLALAIRALPAGERPRVIGVEPRADVRDAVSRGGDALCDSLHATVDAAPLVECDLVVLCAPVSAIEALLGPVSRALRDGAVLSDVAGVKLSVLAAARREVRPGVTFVGAHPMFGGEKGGFASARADAWQSGVVAVCDDGVLGEAVEDVAAFHRALGARIVRCTADAHDAAVALVSHLPFVAAHAIFDVAARDETALSLAGRGFAHATRLAGFAYEVQGEVARRNPHLPGALDAVIARLTELRDALADEAVAREAMRRKR